MNGELLDLVDEAEAEQPVALVQDQRLLRGGKYNIGAR